MIKNQVFFIFFSMLLLFPLASNSDAILWDLQIKANVENSPLYSGERPIVSGVIIDHASKPVYKATVNIRSETMSIFTTTSQSGEFMAELGKHDRIPGNYIVNISATAPDGKTGITSFQFQVKGEFSLAEVNKNKLSTPEAKKYLEASPEDFDKNPIGFILYNYYQKLNQEYLENKKIDEKLAEEQMLKEEEQEIAKEQRLKAIEEFNPSYGVFSGPQYENYVNSLDDEVRDTIVQHLNFTKNLFEDAQKLKNEILENGGTVEEARAAYLEKIAVPREMIENFDINSTNIKTITDKVHSQESDDEITNEPLHQDTIEQRIDLESSSKITNEPLHQDTIEQRIDEESSSEHPIKVNIDGINVEVNYNESIFYVNVNGTILEFLINDDQIVLVNNSE